jgi:voltage-gated potassium channel
MDKPKVTIFYEVLFSCLALFSIGISLFDFVGKISLEKDILWITIDNTILVVFAVDYIVRFILNQDKKSFFKKNIPDLIAIIPFSSIFKIFRVAKLFRVLKITRLLKLTRFARILALLVKFKKTAFRFLKTNGLIYMILITIALIFLGALGIYTFEKGITVNSLQDAIWWSFVTATTVGYGDISPATNLGRVIAALLMLCGIGTIGLLTGTIATYFTSNRKVVSKERAQKSLDLSDLSEEEYREIVDFVNYIRTKKN